MLEEWWAKDKKADDWFKPWTWLSSSGDDFTRLADGEPVDALISKGEVLTHKSAQTIDIDKLKAALETLVNLDAPKLTVGGNATGFYPLSGVVVAGSRKDQNWEKLTIEERLKLLPPQHAYAVIGYDPENKLMLLRNPWNNGNYDFGTTFGVKLATFCRDFDALGYGPSRK